MIHAMYQNLSIRVFLFFKLCQDFRNCQEEVTLREKIKSCTE